MGLFTKLLSKLSEPEEAPAEAPPRWTASGLAEIVRQFPIGSKLLYSPESKRELRLDSLLLGYSVNGLLVFSRDDLVVEGSTLRVRGDGGEVALEEIRSFYMLVPYQARSEIDFNRRERSDPEGKLVQTPVNDFERGALVTLVCFSPYGKVPNLGTIVRSHTVLASGPYASHRVVVLDPLAHTLSHADKRRLHRLRTHLPAFIELPPEGLEHPCVLEDLSERFARVKVSAPDFRDPPEGRRVVLGIEMAPDPGTVLLQGVVFRSRKGSLVLEFKAIFKGGRFEDLQLVDQLELKSRILHHPETERLKRQGGEER